MACGGLAGQLSWICSYPFDIIKTVIQTTDTKKSMLAVSYEKYQEKGI
jgi:Mitochondrial carrier protein